MSVKKYSGSGSGEGEETSMKGDRGETADSIKRERDYTTMTPREVGNTTHTRTHSHTHIHIHTV
jgi:hypothetical protein